MRIALFGLALAVLYLAGARGFLLVLLAAVVSMVLAFLLLRGMRDAVVTDLATRRRRGPRPDVDEAAEDSLL